MNRGHVGGLELQSARAASASCALPACVWPPRVARTPDSGTWAHGGQRPGPEPQEPRACETSAPGSLRQPRSSPPPRQEPPRSRQRFSCSSGRWDAAGAELSPAATGLSGSLDSAPSR